MTKIKRVNAASLARLLGIMYLIIGMIFGAIFAIAAFFEESGDPAMGIGIGILILIGFSLLYGFLGWIGGHITAFLYNFIARKFGGVEIELETTS